MKKYLILYYSKTGNSKFFAEKTAQKLGADIEGIKPIINNTLLLVMFSMLKWGIGTNISTKKLEEYDEVVIWGPNWAGTLIAPLHNVIKKSVKASKNIHFAVTCETSEKKKNNKFGYMSVLNQAKEVGGKFVKTTDGFSLSVLKKDDEDWSPTPSEKPMITEAHFNDFFKPKFDDYIENIRMNNIDEKLSVKQMSD